MNEKIIAVSDIGGNNEIHLAWAIPASRLDEFLSQVDTLAQECGGDPLEEIDLSNPNRVTPSAVNRMVYDTRENLVAEADDILKKGVI